MKNPAYTSQETPVNTVIMDADSSRLIIRKEPNSMETTNATRPAAMSEKEISEAVAELRKYSRIAEEATAQAEAIKDALKAHLTATGTDAAAGLDYKFSWKPVNGSTFDKKAAEAMHPGIIAACTRPNNYRKFLYT